MFNAWIDTWSYLLSFSYSEFFSIHFILCYFLSIPVWCASIRISFFVSFCIFSSALAQQRPINILFPAIWWSTKRNASYIIYSWFLLRPKHNKSFPWRLTWVYCIVWVAQCNNSQGRDKSDTGEDAMLLLMIIFCRVILIREPDKQNPF